ncbi:conserved hypothetical protein [Thermotomaculum hydrothermale]|uniref:PatA-like N-terminal domain-containing protein n=1 Tax=Thermotomaculum hydrothermale TaxID=981385 RepID=A0A7R6PTH8_9BACT|nr:DUF4388 domain-containing protein [Thermotomaculum hydrothermale]BBB32352.1 conserved hypothetical protein [Thermotomaculum hydrothermale]
MALKGTLKDFSLADIFQLIAIQKKTGILSLKRDDEEIDVFFQDGMIVGAESKKGKSDHLLGKLLVRIGAISKEELEIALEIQKNTMKRLGQILIEKNFISQDDLKEALKKRVLEIVYSLFRWRRGSYHFKPLTSVDYDKENFEPLSTESVLMEGLRMIDEWPLIEKKLSKPDMVFRKTGKLEPEKKQDVDAFLVEDEFLMENKPNLPYEMEYVLGLVDGMSSLSEIVGKSKLIEFYTYRALYDLLEQGFIEPTVISAPSFPDYTSKRKAETKSERILLIAVVVGIIFIITLFFSFKSPINELFPSYSTFKDAEYIELSNEVSKIKEIKAREIQRLLNFSFSMKPAVFIRLNENSYIIPGKYGLALPVSFYLNQEIKATDEK